MCADMSTACLPGRCLFDRKCPKGKDSESSGELSTVFLPRLCQCQRAKMQKERICLMGEGGRILVQGKRRELVVAAPQQEPEAQRLGSVLHDLSIRFSLSCLQLLTLLKGGHRRLALLCCLVLGPVPSSISGHWNFSLPCLL